MRLNSSPQFLIEDKDRGTLSARDGGDRELQGDGALAGARRANDEGARPLLHAAAEQGVEFGDIGGHDVPCERRAVLGRHQAGKDDDAAAPDGEIVVAAPIGLPAVLGDAHPAPLGTIIRRQLLQMDDAMHDAVDGLVELLRRHVVKQQNGRALPCEVVLEDQNLPPVAERALREQADFRKAVEHDPRRLHPLEGLEDELGGFAKFEIGGIQEALMLIGIEQAFRWHKLEDVDGVADGPAMGAGAHPQLLLGLREGDVEAAFALPLPLQKEFERNRRFAGAWIAFEQKDMTDRQAAAEDGVEALHTGAGLRVGGLIQLHRLCLASPVKGHVMRQLLFSTKNRFGRCQNQPPPPPNITCT